MKLWLKSLLCISLSFICLFTCIGYAAISDGLIINGVAKTTPALPDIYITGVTPSSSAGVEVIGTSGTVMTAKISGGGTASFTVNVKNISDKIYVYERTFDGSEAGIDGVYSGTDIVYQVYGIAPMDEVSPNGGSRSFTVTVTVPDGVSTDHYVLKFNFVEKFATPGEEEFPEDMPVEEVSLAQRLYNILNNKYKTDIVTNSRDYLINETIQVSWGEGAPPYVGSMDKNYAAQIDALFGDVMKDTNLSFILKNQDLNGDWISEISLYSTTDELDSSANWGSDGVVCVYVTVFTPILDYATWQVVGYNMVCDIVRGYCYEVRYGTDDPTPSFSTDEWRTDVGYMERWDYENDRPVLMPIPDDARNEDGDLYKFVYKSYNLFYQGYKTAPYGDTLGQWLDGKIPKLY